MGSYSKDELKIYIDIDVVKGKELNELLEYILNSYKPLDEVNKSLFNQFNKYKGSVDYIVENINRLEVTAGIYKLECSKLFRDHSLDYYKCYFKVSGGKTLDSKWIKAGSLSSLLETYIKELKSIYNQ
ncbi:hypothetical protein MJ1_0168 [Nanobdella aerobiophila]|uniref:Uncharacterized protein n=1 Tax=Nanobdella aerobiophila TaxID=2586965 RepID=A0A915WRY8_9ARCH|nr:hypothetical protein [Nanobdella aerobiophila]BBL45341.1 hypothetical protein MJ1_0168 [Nanobdella aerobiophila]